MNPRDELKSDKDATCNSPVISECLIKPMLKRTINATRRVSPIALDRVVTQFTHSTRSLQTAGLTKGQLYVLRGSDAHDRCGILPSWRARWCSMFPPVLQRSGQMKLMILPKHFDSCFIRVVLTSHDQLQTISVERKC